MVHGAAKRSKLPQKPENGPIMALEARIVVLEELVAALQQQFVQSLPRARKRKSGLRAMTDAELSAHRSELAKKAREHRWPKRPEPTPKKRKAAKR